MIIFEYLKIAYVGLYGFAIAYACFYPTFGGFVVACQISVCYFGHFFVQGSPCQCAKCCANGGGLEDVGIDSYARIACHKVGKVLRYANGNFVCQIGAEVGQGG